MTSFKKRKLIDERRKFQDKWTNEYFFIEIKNRPICLICSESISAFKEFNVRRHYTTKHSEYDPFQGDIRKLKIESLKQIGSLNTLFAKKHTESEDIVHASYAVSEIIAKHSKNYSDGEFVKECFQAVAKILCPEKLKSFENISMSRRTITRRIEEIAANIKDKLIEKSSEFCYFSLAIDESTDVSDSAQLAIFIRGIDKDFNVTEEMLCVQTMKDTTTGNDIYEEVKKAIAKFNISLERLVSVSTDGAPAMVGSKIGFLSKLKSESAALKVADEEFATFHCIIHQENLFAKSIKFENVMRVVVSCINFIKSRALNHRQFKEFLEELECEYGDLVYYCEVRWLSKGKMLQRFYCLREEICTFLEIKGKFIPELKDKKWISNLAFLVDITTHLNDLNLKLQRENQLIHELYTHVKAFEMKLQIWENHLRSSNTYHFPTLANHKDSELITYADEVKDLKKELSSRFIDFKDKEEDFKIFANPFNADAEKISRMDLQMEIAEIQSNEILLQKFRDETLLNFYSTLPDYPKLKCFARRYAAMFGSTYKCEQLFSRMKAIKSKTRLRLTDNHLEENIRVATFQISPNIEYLVNNLQHQISH